MRGFELETTFLPVENLELTMSSHWYDDSIDEYEDIQLGINASTASGGAFVPSGPECIGLRDVVAGVGTVESCIIDRSDESLPRLPERTLMLAAQYYFETASDRRAASAVEQEVQGRHLLRPHQLPFGRLSERQRGPQRAPDLDDLAKEPGR